MLRAVKQAVGTTMTRQAMRFCERDPITNIPKLARLIERGTDLPNIQRFCRQAKALMADERNPYRSLILRIFNEIAPQVRRKFVSNFVINSGIVGAEQAMRNGRNLGVNIPWAILLDPTSACNLRCKGCWAGEYGKRDNLSFDEMDRIIGEGKELGIFFYLFSGGEPLVRKDDLIRLADTHSECAFLAFTNGTLVDPPFARELVRVGNFALAFSIEGRDEATDYRRGEGVYEAVLASMDIMHEAGAPFGFSTCYHARNVDAIADESYLDSLIQRGCMFGWFFTYIPCGKEALPELITPPEKRAFMFERVRDWRKRKPIFLIDFWNDGAYTNGCIAGGKAYFHINAAGDVEPCAFIHYSDRNIRTSSLVDALRSPLFKAYQSAQPFNENHLRPCPLLDNPQALLGMVLKTEAHSTRPLDEEDVRELTAKCESAAEGWAPTADTLWHDMASDYENRERVRRAERAFMEERGKKNAVGHHTRNRSL